MSYRRALLLLPVLAGARANESEPVPAGTPALHAETLYVIEQLVVNVNSAPDATGTRVSTVKSGDAVEVLERQGEQIHVHLGNGTEGWVRKSYLSEQEPLQHRLNERNAEVEKLKQDVARLESEVAAAQAGTRGKQGAVQANATGTNTGGTNGGSASSRSGTGNDASASHGTPPATASEAANSARADDGNAPEPSHEPPYFMTPPDAPARPVWHWALGSFVVALGLGFALGWQMLDRRIRRKYGGLRIY